MQVSVKFCWKSSLLKKNVRWIFCQCTSQRLALLISHKINKIYFIKWQSCNLLNRNILKALIKSLCINNTLWDQMDKDALKSVLICRSFRNSQTQMQHTYRLHEHKEYISMDGNTCTYTLVKSRIVRGTHNSPTIALIEEKYIFRGHNSDGALQSRYRSCQW